MNFKILCAGRAKPNTPLVHQTSTCQQIRKRSMRRGHRISLSQTAKLDRCNTICRTQLVAAVSRYGTFSKQLIIAVVSHNGIQLTLTNKPILRDEVAAADVVTDEDEDTEEVDANWAARHGVIVHVHNFMSCSARWAKVSAYASVDSQLIQESLANAKGSARQPWHIGRNWLNRPLLIGSPRNINVIYTSLKNTFSAQQLSRWQCGSIFIRLAVVTFQTCQLAQNSQKIWSRSSKVDDFGTNRKRIYEFLLLIISNFAPILNRFWDTATYLLKIAYFSYPSLIRRPRSLSSLWNFTVKS